LIETLDDAYCSELRRTAIGELTLPEVAAGETIRPPAELVGHLHGVEIDDDEERRVRNGIRIPAPAGLGGAGDEPIRLTREGELVAIARAQGGALRTEVVLPVIE
jgi:hypothetical protein